MVEFALKCAKICMKMVENALTFPMKPMFLLYSKRVLDFSGTLMYNLLRKRIGYDSDLPSVKKN